MNYALAAPSGRSVDPRCRKSLMHAVLVAERRGFHMTADHSIFGSHLIMMRNEVQRLTVEDPKRDYEGVVWVDDDILMPQDAIARLLSHQKHFVTGLYFKRGPAYEPLIGKFHEKQAGDWWVTFNSSMGINNGLVALPGGACGFGLCYTSAELLKEFTPTVTGGLNGPFTRLPFIPEPGDDFSFCWRVKQRLDKLEELERTSEPEAFPFLGDDIDMLTLHADTNLLLGHMADGRVITYQDFIEYQLTEGFIQAHPTKETANARDSS